MGVGIPLPRCGVSGAKAHREQALSSRLALVKNASRHPPLVRQTSSSSSPYKSHRSSRSTKSECRTQSCRANAVVLDLFFLRLPAAFHVCRFPCCYAFPEALSRQDVEYFRGLMSDVDRTVLVTDELYTLDVQFISDDDKYFPFEVRYGARRT